MWCVHVGTVCIRQCVCVSSYLCVCVCVCVCVSICLSVCPSVCLCLCIINSSIDRSLSIPADQAGSNLFVDSVGRTPIYQGTGFELDSATATVGEVHSSPILAYSLTQSHHASIPPPIRIPPPPFSHTTYTLPRNIHPKICIFRFSNIIPSPKKTHTPAADAC